jgi:multiple sugar transport system ATP-binding protein
LRKAPKRELDERVAKAARILNLEPYLDRYPRELSGGQRQRVAMGRAIVREADAFLFDEPLSNLDAKLRGQMRTEILRLQRKLGVTTVYVTHDQTEAMTLGDRVAVLKKGVLQQVASPRELYDQPVNLFVAGFIGSPPMNFVPAQVHGDQIELPFVTIPLRDEWRGTVEDGKIYIAGIRPGAFEDAEFVDTDKGSRGVTFEVTIDVTEWLGNEQYAFVPFEASADISSQLAELAKDLDSEQLRTQSCVELDPLSRVRSGDNATLWMDAERLHLFDPQSGENLTRRASAQQEPADPPRAGDGPESHGRHAASAG